LPPTSLDLQSQQAIKSKYAYRRKGTPEVHRKMGRRN
jgi:hypothetical protein